MKFTYTQTRIASYIGSFSQALILNLIPLLFVAFQNGYGLTYEQLGRLTLTNFLIQIGVDLIMVKFGNKIPLRIQVVVAGALSSLGLVTLSVLPNIMTQKYAALMICEVILAVGAGLVEVAVSPIISLLPPSGSKAEIPLLHSFYCWGHVCVCIISTLFLYFAGVDMWRILPLVWATVPAAGTVLFIFSPIPPSVPESERTPYKKLFTGKVFMLALVLMICAGASEQCIAQWTSLFAEKGLQMPKLVGDLVGLCGFAVMMALGRTAFGLYGAKMNLRKILTFSGALCVVAYLGITLIGNPVVSIICCALCGVSVALMWPGVLQVVSEAYPKGGVGMFSLLAVMGDVGCSSGPWLVGLISDKAEAAGVPQSGIFATADPSSYALKIGILCCIVFPAVFTVCMLIMKKAKK